MSLVGTYCNSLTVFKIRSADNANGKLTGRLETLAFGNSRAFEIEGGYHFIDGLRTQTIMFIRGIYKNDSIGQSIFLSISFFAKAATPNELIEHGSSAIVIRTGENPEQEILDIRSLKRSAC